MLGPGPINNSISTSEDENKIKNGKVEVMGINIDISQILGDKIIDQYLAQMSQEDMNKIIEYISSDLWETTYDGDLKVRLPKKNQYVLGCNDQPIGLYIKNQFNERIKDELLKKVDEILASENYQKRADEIANELVEYATNGYKEDMKKQIRERLVGNTIGDPFYNGQPLHAIIDERIQKFSRY